MSIKIRKDVPIEEVRRGRPRKMPFDELEVGHSFTIDSGVKSVRSCVRLFVKTHQPDWEFRLKVLDENKTRVWRVK